jgi:hypothetical protein
MLISRFLLNLRQADGNSHTTTRDDAINRSTIRFNADILVGNMGESLQFDAQNYDDNMDNDNMDENIAAP